jgi:hypothetical protein
LQGQTFFYWIRPRNKSGRYGDWYPAGATSGVAGTTQADETAWTNYIPTVFSSTGSITSYTAGGRYKIIGKTCQFRAWATITNNGTGAGYLIITLPLQALFAGAGSGTPLFVAMKTNPAPAYACMASLADYANPSDASIYKYDGSYPVTTGDGVIVEGQFEIA